MHAGVELTKLIEPPFPSSIIAGIAAWIAKEESVVAARNRTPGERLAWAL